MPVLASLSAPLSSFGSAQDFLDAASGLAPGCLVAGTGKRHSRTMLLCHSSRPAPMPNAHPDQVRSPHFIVPAQAET